MWGEVVRGRLGLLQISGSNIHNTEADQSMGYVRGFPGGTLYERMIFDYISNIFTLSLSLDLIL